MSRYYQIVIDIEEDMTTKEILQAEVDEFIDRLENSIGIMVLTPNEDIIKIVEC